KDVLYKLAVRCSIRMLRDRRQRELADRREAGRLGDSQKLAFAVRSLFNKQI
ncbi:hypothetical protein J6590_106321, partial [Homalodisca vitripennis]